MPEILQHAAGTLSKQASKQATNCCCSSPETNRPPVAHTAGEITVMLPSENIVLDGRNSTDDKGVVGYKWTQTG